MGARIWESVAMEGEPFIVVAYWTAPDKTILNNAGSGQSGVSSTDVTIYKLTGSDSRTQVFSGNLGVACFPVATPTVGDGLTRYAKGWNFRHVFAADLIAVLEGGQTYEFEYRAHGTGALAGVTFDPMVLVHRVRVQARKSG